MIKIKPEINVGETEEYLHEIKDRDGVIFFGLIDPPGNDVKKAIKYAKAFEEGGADVILIGGSLGAASGEVLDKAIKKMKNKTSLPVMLYPGNISGFSRQADALYYMSLMNSRNPYWITGAQSLAAPEIKKADVDAIPTSLLIIEPGETVGYIGDAKPIPAHKPDIASAHALAGEMMGHRVTILERGSGAPAPPSPKMFKATKKVTDNLVICAGSNKNIGDIKQTVKAGADGVHIASIIEQAEDPFKKAKEVISKTKEVGKKAKTL